MAEIKYIGDTGTHIENVNNMHIHSTDNNTSMKLDEIEEKTVSFQKYINNTIVGRNREIIDIIQLLKTTHKNMVVTDMRGIAQNGKNEGWQFLDDS